MIELRRRGFQGVKVAGGNLRLAAAMRLGHAGMATLLSHVLTAIVLGRGHCGTRSGARHDGQHRQQHRQNRNTDFGRKSHAHKSNPGSSLEAMI